MTEDIHEQMVHALGGADAVRLDAGKPRIDLIPPELIFGTAQVLTLGAKKYDARNWEMGMDWSRCFAAGQRHMWRWWDGESIDPETGQSHLSHAATNLGFLMAYEARQIGRDDRP